MSIKPEAIIYTDGSCLGNPGPGGWGAVVIVETKCIELSGGAERTTNNRMELTGAIQALSALRGPHIVRLYTDSQYLVNAFVKGWVQTWKARGWKKTDGELANRDLWPVLEKLTQKHNVSWIWVKGHAGNQGNEVCDRLAVAAAKQFEAGTASPELYLGTRTTHDITEDQRPGVLTTDTPAVAPPKPESHEPQQMSMEDTPAIEPEAAEQRSKLDISDPAPLLTAPAMNIQPPMPPVDQMAHQVKQLRGTVRTLKAAFGSYIQEMSTRTTGIPFPCGGEPWCEYCMEMEPDPDQSGCRCVDAYVAWKRAVTKAQVTSHE